MLTVFSAIVISSPVFGEVDDDDDVVGGGGGVGGFGMHYPEIIDSPD